MQAPRLYLDPYLRYKGLDRFFESEPMDAQKNKSFLFRPHHFLCALGFKGKGYSPSFVRNFASIVKVLRGEDAQEALLTVTLETDDICAPCPHKRGLLCASQEKIAFLDAQHIQALGWQEGETLKWGEARARLKTLTPETFEKICQTCSWQKEGLCLAALEALREEDTPNPE
jgi:uncharacterized protein